jgi:hypothetical protein
MMKSDSGVFLEHPTFCAPLQDRLRVTLQGVSTVPGPLQTRTASIRGGLARDSGSETRALAGQRRNPIGLSPFHRHS